VQRLDTCRLRQRCYGEGIVLPSKELEKVVTVGLEVRVLPRTLNILKMNEEIKNIDYETENQENSEENTIESKENIWDRGMVLGIALIIISLLAKSKLNLDVWGFSFTYENYFDWLFILFLGISIFFFFMGIRLNTDVDEKRKVNDLPNGKQNVDRHLFYQTYLDKFNILSKTSFVISTTFAVFGIIKLLFLALTNLEG